METLPSQELAELLDTERRLLADAKRTGNPAYERAARALTQQSPGRPSFDDRRALAEVRELVERGTTTNRALTMVVATLRADGCNPKSVAERLRRKLKKSATK